MRSRLMGPGGLRAFPQSGMGNKGGVVGLFRVSRANGHASARACMHSPQYVRGYPDPPGTLADGADGTVG